MSTRATYTIKDKCYRGEVSKDFYIHYDGYPEGASEYFNLFINCKNDRGSAIEKFIRAIDLSEFTDKASNHTDREYHYEFNNVTQDIIAYKCSFDSKDLEEFYNGSLAEFLNKYLSEIKNDWGILSKKEFIKYSVGDKDHKRYYTIEEKNLELLIEEKINSTLETLSSGMTGNASYSLSEIKNLNENINNTRINTKIEYIEKQLSK